MILLIRNDQCTPDKLEIADENPLIIFLPFPPVGVDSKHTGAPELPSTGEISCHNGADLAVPMGRVFDAVVDHRSNGRGRQPLAPRKVGIQQSDYADQERGAS